MIIFCKIKKPGGGPPKELRGPPVEKHWSREPLSELVHGKRKLHVTSANQMYNEILQVFFPSKLPKYSFY